MKTILVTISLAILYASYTSGQTVRYRYDAAGACTSRTIDNNKTRSLDGIISIADDIYDKGFSDDIIRVEFGEDIEIRLISQNVGAIVGFIICDMAGYIYGQGKLDEDNDIVRISNLHKGVYVLKIEGGNYLKSYKLIKRKP